MEKSGFRIIENRPSVSETSWSVLILTMLTTGGMIFCLQWMFQSDKSYLPAIILPVAASVFFFWLNQNSKRFLYGCVILLLLIGAGGVVSSNYIAAGFLDFLNQVIAQYNYVTGQAFDYFSVPECGSMELAYVAALACFAAFLAGYMCRAIAGRHSLIVLLCWVPILVGSVYLRMPFTGLPMAWAAMSILGTYAYSRAEIIDERAYALSILVLLLLFGGAGMVCFHNMSYRPSERIAALKESVNDKAEQVRFGTADYPEGKLSRQINTSDELRLEVTVSKESMLYLKGYTGSVFQKNKWQPLDPTCYGKKYEGMIKSYMAKGFHPLSQLDCYLTASSEIKKTDFRQESVEVTVDNKNAYKKYRYLPYGISFEDLTKISGIQQDINVLSDRKDGIAKYHIHVTPQDELISYNGTGWLDEAYDENKISGSYRMAEKDYRKFVKKHYMSVDKKEKEEFSEEFGEKKSKLSDITDNIRIVLSELGEKEPEWTSADYASTGTMMYRWFNVPARYVEGYLVQGKGKINVTAGDAHAWVEIYKEGVGWIPVDVTPGYYKELPQQKKTSLQQEETVSGQQELEETKPQKQGETKKFPSEINRLWIIAGIIVILLMVFMTSLWIYRQIVWRRRVREMEQEEIIKRIRCMSAYMKEMYQYLDRSEEEMGADVRKILECLWYDPNAELHLNKEQLSAMISAVKNCQAEIMQAATGWKKWIIRYWYRLEYPV